MKEVLIEVYPVEYGLFGWKRSKNGNAWALSVFFEGEEILDVVYEGNAAKQKARDAAQRQAEAWAAQCQVEAWEGFKIETIEEPER